MDDDHEALTQLWDEFYREAASQGMAPPGRGRNVYTCRYVRALRDLLDTCVTRRFDPVDYVRTTYLIAKGPGSAYATPKDLLHPRVLKHYEKLKERRGGANSAEAVWLQSIAYIENMRVFAARPLELDAVLESATHPLSATFRLGCRATPPPESLLRIYGESATMELRQDRLLMDLVRTRCPWLLDLLRERHGLDAEDKEADRRGADDDGKPQPTITIRSP